jgi:hypothetical protein
MEMFGTSYNETMSFPYLLLLYMQHDRVRVDYGHSGEDETEVISGKELLKRKRGR